MSWQDDKAWADKNVRQARTIVGYYATQVACDVLDIEQATDLITERKQVAWRMRRRRNRDNFADFGNTITVRSKRPSGVPTELDKIREGFGDWFLLCYPHSNDEGIEHWGVFNLDVFREVDRDWGWIKNRRDIWNYDGSSAFRSYPITKMPDAFIVGASPGLRQRLREAG